MIQDRSLLILISCRYIFLQYHPDILLKNQYRIQDYIIVFAESLQVDINNNGMLLYHSKNKLYTIRDGVKYVFVFAYLYLNLPYLYLYLIFIKGLYLYLYLIPVFDLFDQI